MGTKAWEMSKTAILFTSHVFGTDQTPYFMKTWSLFVLNSVSILCWVDKKSDNFQFVRFCQSNVRRHVRLFCNQQLNWTAWYAYDFAWMCLHDGLSCLTTLKIAPEAKINKLGPGESVGVKIVRYGWRITDGMLHDSWHYLSYVYIIFDLCNGP